MDPASSAASQGTIAGSTAPINQLPVELLGAIFKFCVPRQPFGGATRSFPYAITTPKEAPLFFTRVCTTWRALAINTPHLWTIFAMHTLLSGDKRSQQSTRLLSLFITRSQNLPFSFHLTSFDIPQRHVDSALMDGIRKALASILNRIHTFDCDIPLNQYPLVQSFPLHRMSALHALRIDKYEAPFPPYRSQDPGNQCALIWSMPHLRVAVLHDTDEMEPDKVSLPWDQLEYLELDSFYWQPKDVLAILKQCRALRSFCLGVGGSDYPPYTPDNLGRVNLPHLTRLRLDADGSDFSVLSSISCPNLRELVLVGNLSEEQAIDSHPDPCDMALDFIKTCAQNLTSLTLHDVPFSLDELVSCMELTLSLAQLTVWLWPLSTEDKQEFVCRVLIPNIAGSLLPALEQIILPAHIEGVLTDTLRTRFGGDAMDSSANLRPVRILYEKEDHSQFLQSLWAAEATGSQ